MSLNIVYKVTEKSHTKNNSHEINSRGGKTLHCTLNILYIYNMFKMCHHFKRLCKIMVPDYRVYFVHSVTQDQSIT